MGRRTVKVAFCQWLAQTWLVIPTRTQHVSQWEEMYGSWLKLIVNAGSLTEWCARATVSHFWVDSSNCWGFPKSCTAGVNFPVLFLFSSDRIISCNLLSLGIIEWLDYWTVSCLSWGLTNKVALMSHMLRVLKIEAVLLWSLPSCVSLPTNIWQKTIILFKISSFFWVVH